MATPFDGAARTFRRPVSGSRRLGLVLVGLLGVLLSTVPAQAAPTSSAQAAALVAARGHDLEAVSEKFNEARVKLAAQQAATQRAVAAMKKATADLAEAQKHVRGIARTAFTSEGMGSFKALMTSDNATDFVDRMATLQTIAGHQNAVLQRAATANVTAARAQATAQKSAAAAKATYDTIAAEQTRIKAQIAEYKAAFSKLSAQEQRVALEGAVGRASRAERAPVAAAGPVVANSRAAQIAVDTALAQRGKPYVWAADGPGSFDCSGLVAYAYAAAGIGLPHSSRLQSLMGQPVSRSDLQPGDLVFFYSPVSHVGIYIGNGLMVHAPTSGDVVKVSAIDAMGGYHSARRISA